MVIRYHDAIKHGIKHPAFRTEGFERGLTEAGAGATPEKGGSTAGARTHRSPIPISPYDTSVRVRLVQANWDHYTGQYGPHMFKDGVSIDRIPQVFVDRIAAQVRCVNADTGNPLGLAQRMIDADIMKIEMPVAPPLQTAPEGQLEKDQATVEESKAVEQKDALRLYSYDELCALVDEKGINGLREVAAPYGVKGRSIPDLITALLNAQDTERGRRKDANA